MDSEEKLIKSFVETENEAEDDPATGEAGRNHKFRSKNTTLIDRFLGNVKRTNAAAIVPRYYGDVLAWSFQQYIVREGWKVAKSLGYRCSEPVFYETSWDYGKSENLIWNGQLFITKGKNRLLITLDITNIDRNVIIIEGPSRKENDIKSFADGVLKIAKEENFYRGKKFEFGYRLRFLDVAKKSWESVVLDDAIKNYIRANTIDFLHNSGVWQRFGIPSKRGILLAGEPGTGKTIICKALMAEAQNITCITAKASDICERGYIDELYEAAQDLSPCMVFIEDVDLVGQNRMEYGYSSGTSLITLLSVLDGIEEKQEIVTVATTNCLEILDKALSERPSRFDRVIRVERPDASKREELVGIKCRNIPLSKEIQKEIARKTTNFTPAQIQEVIHCLLIENYSQAKPGENQTLNITSLQVDAAISHLSGMNRHPIGFLCGGQKTNCRELNIQNKLNE